MTIDTLSSAQEFSASIRKKTKVTGAGELKVDPNFIEEPNAAKVLEFAVKRQKNVLLVGPTGCGKSCLGINVLARLGMAGEVFSCSGETSTDDLIGKILITEGPNGQPITSVAYGAAVRAYKEGKALLLEEIDHANADILSALHRLMELNQTFYILNVGTQEIIQKAPGFCVLATANTIGNGEDTFQYAGTKPINNATLNRFSYTIRMGYLDRAREVKIVKAKTGVDGRLAEQMVAAANYVRDRNSGHVVGEQVASVISTRDLLEWADAVVGMQMHPREAAQYAFLNRVSESDREYFQKAIENECPV